MRDPRLAKLADVLVNYSSAVRGGELVCIRGSTVTEPLVIETARAVIEAGGHPHVRMWPEEVDELRLKLGNDAQLDYLNPLLLHEMQTIDVLISFWGGANTKHLSGCDPARQARSHRARKPILDAMMRRESLPRGHRSRLRWVGSQYPTHSAAQDAGMSLAEYEEFVYRAGMLDRSDPVRAWKTLSVAQQRLCDLLSRGRELRFVHPDGTDLRLGVAGRRWINCDGAKNFPDGEVFTGPIEDATTGVVQFRFPAVHGGREINDVRLVFKAGRVVECSASKGEDFLVRMLDQDRGSRILGEAAIGTNFEIRRYSCNTLFDEKIGGTFHVALGAAYPESGGRNSSALHWDLVCDLRRGGRIELDGRVISKDGRFLDARLPQPRRSSARAAR